MATNIDFDISSYSTEELINIIGLGGELPLTNEKIVKKIQEMKDQFDEKYEDDEYIIKVNNILNLKKSPWIETVNVDGDTHPIFSIYFNPYYEVNTNATPNQETDQIKIKKIVTDWNKWSTSEYSKEFRNELDRIMSENAVFSEYIDDKIDIEIISEKYGEALNIAEGARDDYIFFFDEIAHRLREFRKEEYKTNYYEDEEENEKSLLEGDFMDDNEKILATNNFTMPIWDRTTFKGTPPTMPKDYKNPLLKRRISKTINIDSQYRTIADPVVCIRCPDTLEYYAKIPEGKTSVSNKFSVVASNNDGRLLIAGNSSQMLHKLDISKPDDATDTLINRWTDISFNNNILEANINKEWKDITMNYGGDYIAVCNKHHIWYSNKSGNDNTWERGNVSYLTNVDLSNSDISGNWNGITSDFTGQYLFATRTAENVSGRISALKKGGVCYSDDYAATWKDLSNGQITLSDGINSYNFDLSQNWVDIKITGDGEKVYGIYKTNNKYYIVKSINKGLNWQIINNSKWDYTTNTELCDYEWEEIVTNFYGTKIFIRAKDYGYIWRSFDSGTNWSKVTELDSSWNSITCSLDGLKVAVWDNDKDVLIFSENGGSVWNNPAKVSLPNKVTITKSNIVISADGDRILGLDYNGNIFTSKKCVETDVSLFDRPSNFTVNLSEPIKNVFSISIKNIELPHSWDIFSKNEGTNVFYVKKANDDIIKITIPEGSYHYNNTFGADINLITILNTAINDSSLSNGDLVFSYKGSNNISITNNSGQFMTIYWHREESNDVCGYSGQGTRVNYNLGWLLGFRKTLIGLAIGSEKTGTAKLNLRGTKYVYISLDEFSNNKAPDSCISYENNTATFNMPSYFVKTTMQPDVFSGKVDEKNKCYVEPDPLPGNCGKKRRNPDSIDNLTTAQRYTIETLRNALSVPKKNQYRSPIISNYFAKVQLRFNTTASPAVQYTTERRVEASQEKREYFGPITLRKFHIRLLNERGNEINMNEDNWSFTLLIDQLYNNA